MAMRSTRRRLLAAALAVSLPLAAVAGCGAEKKRTVKAEFASALGHLENASATSFTFRMDDSQRTLRTLMTKDDEVPQVLADALVGGSVTVTVDAGSSETLADIPTESDPVEQLKAVNLSILVRDDRADLGELRLVDGLLGLRLNMAEIVRLVEAGGVEDVDAELDAFVAEGPPEFTQLLMDLRSGRWVTLDLAEYADALRDLAGATVGIEPSAAPSFDAKGLGSRLFEAIQPSITVKDANDSSADRVLDVAIDVRPALKAALKVLSTTKDFPFAEALPEVDPAEIDKEIADGLAKGQIRLSDGHLRSVSVDVESLRLLAKDPGEDSVAGLSMIFEIDDAAERLVKPTDVSTVDLGELVEDFLSGLQEGFEGDAAFTEAA
jgi:hypothetical protein